MAAKATDRTRTKFLLDEKDIPTKWYNIQADLKTPAPPVLHPGTQQPIGPQDLAPLFPMELIRRSVAEAKTVPGAGLASGAGTDHLEPGPRVSTRA